MSSDKPPLPLKIKNIARKLREESTIPERILWGVLRNRQIANLKFRRQHPIGPFVADFCCMEKKLIVELDGLSHVGTVEADLQRTEYLKNQGFTVLRVTNDDVLNYFEPVILEIARKAGVDW